MENTQKKGKREKKCFLEPYNDLSPTKQKIVRAYFYEASEKSQSSFYLKMKGISPITEKEKEAIEKAFTSIGVKIW